MDNLSIVLITASIMVMIEGLTLAVFPKRFKRTIAKLIKKEKDIRGVGLVELIIGLLIIFLVSL